MTAAHPSLATAHPRARFARGSLPLSYTTRRGTTKVRVFVDFCPQLIEAPDEGVWEMQAVLSPISADGCDRDVA